MARRPAEARAATVAVPRETAERRCREALGAVGTAPDVAGRVAAALVRSEARGLVSHGLLRLDDYLREVAAGTIRPGARPSVSCASPAVRVVDGGRGFGVLAADEVAHQLCDALAHHDLAAVALVNSNHVGALGQIGEAVAARGLAVLGFVNYLGAGQRVLPWRGRRGRLCTNPLLVAVPGGSGPPFVLDMSTSTVAEGRVRARLLAGRRVPAGWLVDDRWRPVTDPARLYLDPATAFLTPLGGAQGHKGFGLALAVELLGGVLTGAGTVGAAQAAGGNGGLFLGLRPTLFGRSAEDLAAEADAVRRHTTDADGEGGATRWPGDRGTPLPGATDDLVVDAAVWRSVEAAAAAGREAT